MRLGGGKVCAISTWNAGMNKTPFIWLGAGRAKKRGVARRGRQLDAAARAGLPVPDGAILLDELLRIFLKEGIAEQVGEKVVIPDPIWLLEVLYRDVRFPRLKTTANLCVIPTNGYEGLLAPEAVADEVDLEDAQQLAAALSKVWSFPAFDDNFRRDVAIVTTVQGGTAGRARSTHADPDDVVAIISGSDEGEIHLPRLGRWERPFLETPPFARRLQMLLRGVRRTLSDDEAIDFFWLDDGQVCWITQFN
jgi:hypothetical protein